MLKPNILIVDDCPENLSSLHAVLDSPEYTITECTSGMEALGHLLSESFELILMDVHMPEVDGFQTAEMIRQNVKIKEIPLIFITATFLDEESQLKAYQVGAADYMIKPFHPDTLRKKIHFFLNYGKHIRREQQSIDAKTEYGKFMIVYHDMVNPLWTVLLSVQLLKKYFNKNDATVIKDLRNKLECLEESTKKLNNLILKYQDQLSKFSDRI